MKKLSTFTFILGILALTFSSVLPASAATQYAPEDMRVVSTTQVVSLYGQLLGVGNTTAPGSFNIRVDDTDYVIYFDGNTLFLGADDRNIGPDWFLPGDWIRVTGYLNGDGLSLDADVVINTSVRVVGTQNVNGWIQSVDPDNNQATMIWGGKTWRLDFTENSRIVAAFNFDASVSDLQVGDRVRGRGIKHAEFNIVQVKLLVVLRRGIVEWVKNNTEIVRGPLLSINTDAISSTAPAGTTAILKVRDSSRDIDFTIYVDEDTKVFRRWFGGGAIDDLLEGDYLGVIGKRATNDSTEFTARIIRNHSLGMVTSKGIPGTIVSIDAAAGNFILERLGVLWRIDVNDFTHLVVVSSAGVINPASIGDLQVGDMCRGRGIRHASLNIVLADAGVCRR